MTENMSRSALTVQGVDVLIEGERPDALVMIHGWPDTHHLWDSSVQALKPFFRCVRFTLPGYDLEKPPRATSLAQMTALLADIVDAVSPARPVHLLLHDWGCVFGYEFAAARPERVARAPDPAVRYSRFPQATGSLAQQPDAFNRCVIEWLVNQPSAG
jgi:pimeloyl-ACP methyl ester carboxylesterase